MFLDLYIVKVNVMQCGAASVMSSSVIRNGFSSKQVLLAMAKSTTTFLNFIVKNHLFSPLV